MAHRKIQLPPSRRRNAMRRASQVLAILGLAWIGTAGKLGASHFFFWMAAIVFFYVPSAAVVIHLNNEMPLEGGLYQWAKLRFNEMTGFLVAWNMWIYAI